MRTVLKDLLWYCLLTISLGISLYQIEDLVNDWNTRPIETLFERLAKQNIPYPSVTICGEGSTFYPAIEIFLNEQNISYKKFHYSIKSYLRIQIEFVRFFISNYKMMEYYGPELMCKTDHKMFETFCIFLQEVAQTLDQMVESQNLRVKVLSQLSYLRHNYVHLFKPSPHVLIPNSSLEKLYRIIWSIESESDKMNNDKQGLATVLAYTIILQLIEEKFNANKLNMMNRFLYLLNGHHLMYDNSTFSFPAFKEVSYRHDRDAVILPIMPISFVSYTEMFFKNTLQSKLDTNRTVSWIESNSTFYAEMYIIYMQLMYLQVTNLNKGVGSKITQLMMYNSWNDLPLDSIIDFKTEIHEQLTNIFNNELKWNNITWSINDAIKLFITYGTQSISEKLSNYIFFSGKRSHIEQAVSGYKDPQQVCNETKYKKICNQIKVFTEITKHNNMQKLLHNTAHPPMINRNLSVRSQPMSLLPFCFIGKQITQILDSLRINKNFMKGSKLNYEFCTRAQQVYTDSGLCTSLNFLNIDTVFNSNYLSLPFSSKRKAKVIYPQTVARKLFEDGFYLILDSCAFNNVVTQTKDNEWELFRNTILESKTMNNFKILLHDKNEAPMLLHSESSVIQITKDNTVDTLQSFFSSIKVRIEDADENIRDIPMKKRNCRFEDETDGLQMFIKYSKSNCLYECMTNLAKKKCQCTPWNFPHQQTDKTCDLFGNFCFNNHILWLMENLETLKELGKPPCGCYPSCRSYQYIPVKKTYKKDSPTLLNVAKMTDSLETIKNQLGSIDIDYAKDIIQLNNAKQYLAPYILDTISPKQSKTFQQREAIGQLQFLYKNETADLLKAKNSKFSDRVKNFAAWHMDFDQAFYTVSKKVRRESLANMLSSYGGILSLFTGFSFMGLFDVVCWLIEWAYKFIYKIKTACLMFARY